MRTRPLKVVALTGVLALVLSGCLKMDLDLELQPDDTIDGSMIVAVDTALAEMMELDPEAMAAEMRDEMLSGDGPDGVTAEPYDDGDYIGSTMTFEGEPLDAFSEDGSLVITRDGDEFVVDGTLDLTDEGAEEVPGLTDSLDVRVAVTFPGEVTEHDGELDGSTVTWVPAVGERTEIHARGGAETGALGGGLGGASALGLLALVGTALAVLVVLGLVIFLVVRSRRSGESGPPPATAYAAGPPAPPGGPGPTTSSPPGPATAYGPGPTTAYPTALPPPTAPPTTQAPPADAPTVDQPDDPGEEQRPS